MPGRHAATRPIQATSRAEQAAAAERGAADMEPAAAVVPAVVTTVWGPSRWGGSDAVTLLSFSPLTGQPPSDSRRLAPKLVPPSQGLARVWQREHSILQHSRCNEPCPSKGGKKEKGEKNKEA
ncbi:unnamed protein product [Arctogadus glacialis]